MAQDLILFPSCDLHVALHGTPPLTLRITMRIPSPDNMSYTLVQAPISSCRFDFFAPYNPVGNRLQQFVSIDPVNGQVTPISVGTNLIQIRLGILYIIARIQVHETILGWWFGNSSITTAKDNKFAHAQPSIYALFSDDPSGTDLVGDITGHGYVPLTSSNNTIITPNANGRLQGLQEGDTTISGTFLNITHSIPVKVVDYEKPRNKLEYVQIPNMDHPETMHNILFIGEGFRDNGDDRAEFDKIVTQVVEEMFSKPRHSPYQLLEGSFNIWKVYEPSVQHAVTCGFRINDEDAPILRKGYPIPYNGQVSINANTYNLEMLIKIVGLPLRNEARNTGQLKALWSSQSLKVFDPATQAWVDRLDPSKVDDTLVEAWKVQKSVGILEARDTFFGLYLGMRYGDRHSSLSADPRTHLPSPVLPPAADNPADANLFPFIKRVYEWFDTEVTRNLSPDPRRHPPELQASIVNDANPGNSIFKYIGSLRGQYPPNPNIGQEWVPDPTETIFKKSRGLVALITNDILIGGTNFNKLTITANTLAGNSQLEFQYSNAGNERIMRRTLPDSFNEDIDFIINTIAHEFGHSFNLGDEYESFPGDQPHSNDGYDNIAALGNINLHADYQDKNSPMYRKLDPDKIKWFDLLRFQLSDTLTQDSETENGQIKITIDPRFIGRWVEAKAQNLEAYLRRIEISPTGKQLPLPVGEDHYLTRLQIGNISSANGSILLGGLELPPEPLPVFPKGSVLFIPKRNSAGELVYVVEKKVLEKLKATNLPLNKDPDVSKVNQEADDPIDITDFKPPCKAYKLIGIYEGANFYTGMVYRPSGLCKLRKSSDTEAEAGTGKSKGKGHGEFCHVCKYLIVQRVDPSLLDVLDWKYYPGAKKSG
jgi:hypothetical protein